MRHNARGIKGSAGARHDTERAWTDVSAPLANGMVHWPGDPAFHVERVLDQSKGDPANVSLITMGSHTGTHMDAPVHFIPGGIGIDQAPLDVLTGPALIIDTGDADVIAAENVGHDVTRRRTG